MRHGELPAEPVAEAPPDDPWLALATGPLTVDACECEALCECEGSGRVTVCVRCGVLSGALLGKPCPACGAIYGLIPK